MNWDGNGSPARATEWTRERDPELAAFHHHTEDMTETVWFLVRFFLITFGGAVAFIAGFIFVVRKAMGL